MENNNTIVPQLRFPEFRESAGWEEKKLGELCVQITKGTTPTTLGFKYQDYGINFIKIESINNEGKVDLDKAAFISEACHNALQRSKLQENDILFSIAGALGVISRVENKILPANTNQALAIVRVKKEYSVNYIIEFLKSPIIQAEVVKLKAGAAQPNISLSQIGNFSIHLPSSKEQQKIADCLSSLDDLIAAESAKLEALGVHKKGLMQRLFPAGGETVPRLRFSEFKESGDWEEKMLGEVCFKISDGIHSTPKYDVNGNYYFVNGNNLINGSIIVDENTKKVSEQEYKLHQKDLGDNSILLSINGTIGNLAQYKNEKVVLGKSACYINIDKSKTNIDFIYNYLQTDVVKNYFEIELTGSTIKNLSLKTIKNSLLGFPTLPEQQKIADCLSSLDALLAAQQLRIAALQRHKQGLMQQLFPAAL